GSEIKLLDGIAIKIVDIRFSDIRDWIITYRIIGPEDRYSILMEPVEATTKTPYWYKTYGFIVQVDSTNPKNPTVEATIYRCY
ncbi:hypothetical protein HZC08_00090, partial [Candidatus Micrarchaeota archaeon]|nr:hypothetical protein [Candidatus Micrarchaeota archaeon]